VARLAERFPPRPPQQGRSVHVGMIGLMSVVLSLAIACGDSPTKPTAVTPTGPAGTVDPAPTLTTQIVLKVDDAIGREPVASASEVSVEATAGNASGAVTWSIDFGDGTMATSAAARHTYPTPGSFTIRAEARDAGGRSASSSQAITVQGLSGTLVTAGFNARTGKMEVRTFTIGGQSGATVTGTYRTFGAPERPFTGTLAAPRTLRMAVAGSSEAAEGTLPDQVSTDGSVWPLTMRGDSVDGVRLDFKRASGSPAGPAPDAVSVLDFGRIGGGLALTNFTLVTFDATRSSGNDLSYYVEFGDGQTGIGATVTHRPSQRGYLTSRLTVVDRFGRSDAESVDYVSLALGDSQCCADGWVDPSSPTARVAFREGGGSRYSGSVVFGFGATQPVPVFAELSGDNRVVLSIPSLGIELSGEIVATSNTAEMVVVQSGGAEHGRTRRFIYDDGPG
jgi:hypothetical protein